MEELPVVLSLVPDRVLKLSYKSHCVQQSGRGGNTRPALRMGDGNQDGRFSVFRGTKANAHWKDSGESPCEWHRFVTG